MELSGKKSFKWEPASNLACGQVWEALSWLMTDVWAPPSTVGAATAGQVVLGT